MRKLALILPLFALLIGACQKRQTKSTQSQKSIVHAYDDYVDDWREIEKMEQRGLGKQIIEKTDNILTKAIAQQNTSQIFKALAYRSKYINQVEEESHYKILTQFEEEIERADFPVSQLLNSATAELYYQYYQQNRWRFHNRTKTIDFQASDLRTWSLDQILSKIDEHYQASLKDIPSLKSYPISNLKAILTPISDEGEKFQEDASSLRPSLFDFLVGRALLYYQNNEGRVNQPQNEFQLNSSLALAPIERFVSHSFNTIDSTSASYRAIQLYQVVLKEHIKDEITNVLIDFNLNRLRFAHSRSTQPIKDSLYIAALQYCSDQYMAEQAEIDFRLAQFYYQQSIGAEKDGDWKKKAHELCLKHATKESFGGLQCKTLLEQIVLPKVQFRTEEIALPNQPIQIAVTHQNMDAVYFSIYSIPTKVPHQYLKVDYKSYLKKVIQQKPIRSWRSDLLDPKDFNQHISEVQTGAIPFGKYVIVGSNQERFDVENESFASTSFTVSNLAFIKENRNSDSRLRLFTLNRNSGKAEPQTEVLLYKDEYDYSTRKNKNILLGKYTSDHNGELIVKDLSSNSNVEVILIKKQDTLSKANSFYFSNWKNTKESFLKTYYFTDRAIYRPGQSIYFKGIVIEHGEHSNQVQKNYSTEVVLYDVNGEKVASKKVKTNEYGSFQGSFELPSSGLTGNFRIRSKHGTHYVSVEEYKRPSFEVILDTSKGKRKINSTINIQGKVMAYSGAPIGNATLNYRVVRRASYPYWNYWRGDYPGNTSKEIANGEINANSNGVFGFDFFAQAEEASTAYPVHYNFEVNIEATSPSGETQSLAENIVLGNQEVYLSTNLSDAVQLKDLNQLIVFAKNINNQKIDEKVKISLWKLESPKQITPPKKWAIVNDRLKSSSKKLDLNNLKRESKLLVGQVSCNQTTSLFGQLKTGAYELVIEQVGGENNVSIQQRFTLFDETAQVLPFPLFSYFNPLKTKVEPGEKASFLIGTSLKELSLFYYVTSGDKVIKEEWIKLRNEQRKIEIPIEETYRGGIEISLIGVHSNQNIQYQKRIKVPFTNKQLKLSLGTFRDKVEPGSKEKWTMSIQGAKGEKLAAEVLAGMYDQSLDQFKSKQWGLSLYRSNYSSVDWELDNGYGIQNSRAINRRSVQYNYPSRIYPSLNWFGFYLRGSNRIRGARALYAASAEPMDDNVTFLDGVKAKAEENESVVSNESITSPPTKKNNINPIRTDFRETAFFYPQLRTDATGNVSFEFTMPDALTQWKFRALAHTTDLKIGTLEQSIRTQRKLMVQPTVPRFFRENDQLEIKVSIINLSDDFQLGYAKLSFYDAFTNRKIDLSNGSGADLKFNIPANQSTVKSWKISIPEGIQAIKYRVEAQADDFSDGEEKVIPVLLNRTLVTESLPLAVRGNQQKDFSFDRLINANSSSLDHVNYTIEFTPNPAWYAVQALPYLTENSTKCSEQIFTRFYANTIAEKIANDNPRIQQIFDLWKREGSEELSSKLFQNVALKNILIEETPWLQQAKTESERKRRIALLFDFNKMAKEKDNALQELKNLQSPNGGWPWYKGMRDNRYITQYIVNGLGHLQKLGVDIEKDPSLKDMLQKAIGYLDQRIEEDYKRLKERKIKSGNNYLGSIQIHYLYTKGLFPKTVNSSSDAYQFYLKQAKTHWTTQSLYLKGMLGLALHYLEPSSEVPSSILVALRDNAIQSEQLGMYWKENQPGFYWYNSAIETQALLIEFFKEVDKNKTTDVEEMQIWLLKEKQSQAWSNTKATALACYALLMNNATLNTEGNVSITVGKKLLEPSAAEAGTGYFKKTYQKNEIQAKLGKISVDKKDKGIAWGAAYWQYYEDLNKITAANVEELSVSKVLFKVVHTAEGESMIPIESTTIKVGDKVRVRLRIESKRNLEFVHLKDTRASGLEPVNVLSGYRYQDGLGYYESTRDASTNFFMDNLPKGVYIFEYDLRASVSGSFSNGLARLQCQYAPEFTTHSDGKKVNIQ